MAETEFAIVYDGAGLTDGRIEVRSLAPALLALADLFQEANAVTNPGAPAVSLDIKATGEGSFIVDLILRGGEDIIDLFNSPAAQAVLNLKDYVIGGGFGLFKLIKWAKNRHLRREQLPNGMVRLTLPDGTVLEVPVAVLEMYGDVTIRRRAREVMEPLQAPGIDTLEFREESQTTISLGDDDLSSFNFEAPAAVELASNSTEMFVAIASATFTDGNKWRVSDGEQNFYVAMSDAAFLARVDAGEAFRKGDRLRCRMTITQSEDDKGLHTEREITQVIEHISVNDIRGRQLGLPYEA